MELTYIAPIGHVKGEGDDKGGGADGEGEEMDGDGDGDGDGDIDDRQADIVRGVRIDDSENEEDKEGWVDRSVVIG